MDPSKMKVVDLRSELGALGLDTKGNKPALVERLRKALETKTGKALPDSSILDTSTEDADEPSTPKRTPAARTTRRSSSSRLASTPAKPLQLVREEPPEPIEEEVKVSEQYSPGQEDSDSEPSSPVKQPEPKSPPPEPKKAVEPQPVIESPISKKDEKRTSYDKPEDPEPMDTQEAPQSNEQEQEKAEDITEKVSEDKDKGDKDEKMDQDADVKQDKNDNENQDDKDDEEREAEAQRKRELTEEEEWKQLNERLKLRDEERIERERKQAEDDAKKLEEVSKDPVKLNRLKRKQQKKARWSNFYRAVEVTNEMLTLPEEVTKEKKVEVKIAEPEIDENKMTLSWYDSDLNQYLELPELNSVVPLTDGAFAHAWAGSRASHGVEGGRVCYEVSVGTVVTTTETTEKESVASGLRIGWSTTDSSLHLGDGEVSWGFESTGRAVHNGEFKEYGKALVEKDVVGAYLDLESNPCKISYTLNGLELGVAFEFDKAVLEGKPLFPHILTKNQCYKVNFGNDRYNMLTKTKLVRTRIEIPVEQVLEEKRRIEEELQRQKDEAAKKERERRDRDRKEREERQRKKREERERVERERKEKEDQEKRDRGEEVPTEAELAEKQKEQEKQQENEQEKEADKDAEAEKESEQPPVEKIQEEPKENGEKPIEVSEKEEPKSESMETESSEAKTEKDIKAEPVTEVVEITEEQVLKGQVLLDKKIKFVIRYLVEEELDGTEVCLVPGYVLISHADLVEGPPRPASLADCEVILMVGLPGAGKTHWVRAHVAANPAKRYNILSTGALQERMKVDCKPFRATYEGRWDAMVSKCAKCVLKLLEIAKGRRRNFILDQTNVYPSAQRRKLREFDGYRRVAVVIVTDDETYRDRHKRREEADGKEVPDPAIVDMKANFALPEKCSWLDEVIFPELGEEAARTVLEEYHKEARAAGVSRDKDKRERSASRDQPPQKRHRSNDKSRHGRDSRPPRDFGRDREDRWGGGGGGSRWGGSGGGGGGGGRGGSRWGPRESRGPPAGGPNQSRFDRPWQPHGPPPPPRGGDFGGRGDRDNFRGGRGGGGGGGRPDRGGRGGGPPSGDRFGRDRPPRPNDRPDKRPHPSGGSGGGGGGNNNGGGGGGWQRGAPAPPGRAAPRGAAQQGPPRGTKDGPNQNQNANQANQQGWNQWAGGWGGWGNWGNQNPAGWQNWGNWGNWNNANQGSGGNNQAQGQGAQGAKGQGQGQGQNQQQQWPANYTAQQWYQWQQWQQQQQQAGWPGYQQGNQTASQQDQAQAWAQYYQNYAGNANAGGTTNAVTGGEKK